MDNLNIINYFCNSLYRLHNYSKKEVIATPLKG